MMRAAAASSGEAVRTPLNVVFSGNFLYPQGMAGTKRVQHFIDSIVAVGGNKARVLLYRQGHLGRDERHLAGEHHGVPYVTIGHGVRLDWRLPWALIRYVWDGCAWLHRWRVPGRTRNVLFLYGVPSLENFLFVLFARITGYKVVIDVVEDFYLVAKGASLLSRMKARSVVFAARRMGWFADGMVVISTYLYDKFDVISRGRFPVCLIPVSVNTSRIVVSTRSFHDPVRIVYAGSFGEKDGVENLITAFNRVICLYPNLELLLAGKGMVDRIEKMKLQIEQSAVGERIHYLGFLSDADYYQAICDADILCVVRVQSDFSDRGFPFKLGEFLATGRPVIASSIGDVPDYLTDRRDIMLVEPGSVESIADAIKYLVQNQPEALDIGAGGRTVAEQKFDTQAHAQMFRDLVDALWITP